MTNILWVDILIVSAAVVTACGVIWRKFLRPLLHALNVASEALPVMLAIAAEFSPNHGSSLRDVVNRIESKADLAIKMAEAAAVNAAAAKVVGESVVENVGSLTTAIETLNDLH